ncbi:Outer-membrane lipoprotein carrier protein [Oligella ureolytica]
MAQFTVSPDAFQGGIGEVIDLGDIQFTKIPDVKNTTQNDAKQQLRDFVKNIKSATGQFAQQSGGGAQGQGTQSGTFSFERPGKFVWNIVKPYEQKVISDGQKVYQYDPDLAQVTIRNVQDSVGASPAPFIRIDLGRYSNVLRGLSAGMSYMIGQQFAGGCVLGFLNDVIKLSFCQRKFVQFIRRALM